MTNKSADYSQRLYKLQESLKKEAFETAEKYANEAKELASKYGYLIKVSEEFTGFADVVDGNGYSVVSYSLLKEASLIFAKDFISRYNSIASIKDVNKSPDKFWFLDPSRIREQQAQLEHEKAELRKAWDLDRKAISLEREAMSIREQASQIRRAYS